MQKIRLYYSVYLIFILCNVIIYAQELPTKVSIDVIPKIGLKDEDISYLTDWVFNGIYNYHEGIILTEGCKHLSTESTMVDNLEDMTEVEFLEKPLYDLFLQQANTILKETDISLKIKTESHSLLSNERSIQYYQYLWENSINWQMETYITSLDQRMRYYKKERKDELFISFGLVLIKRPGLDISYSIGRVLSPISSESEAGSNDYINQKYGIMCGIFGIVRNGIGAGLVIDTGEQILYDRLWISTLE